MSNVMEPTRPFGDSTNAGASTRFVQLATGSIPATFVTAVVAATTNIQVPHPNLSLAGDFILDGQIVNDLDLVFFSVQTNLVQNGLWLYTKSTNTLSRPATVYTSGTIIYQPYYVQVDTGDTLGGQTFGLQNPPSVLIDTSPSIWVNTEVGGLLLANQGTFGDTNPTKPARPALKRLLSAFDIQPYDSSIADVTFPQTIYDSVAKIPRLSDYVDPTNPWSTVAAINAILGWTNTLIFDCAFNLGSQITASLSGKRLISMGSGKGGPCRIVMQTLISSFLDFSAAHDVILEGFWEVIYPFRANAGIKAIKGTTFQNVKIDSLYTSGIDYAISVDGTIDGFEVNEVEVAVIGTDIPLNIGVAAAPTSLRTKIGQVRNIPAYQTDPGASGSFIYFPWTMSPVVNLNGTETANRTVTLSLVNASEGYRATFLHNAAGGFNYSIGGLKTIVNGQNATVMISNGAWVLVS